MVGKECAVWYAAVLFYHLSVSEYWAYNTVQTSSSRVETTESWE